MQLLKRLISYTPEKFQELLKLIHHRRLIKLGKFVTDEPEFAELGTMVKPGDWVIDIGANIGHYTVKLSDLVGESGRVISFEPVPTTFAHLSANIQYCRFKNISLINAAASDHAGLAGMSIPYFDTGLKNFYRANINDEDTQSDYSILTLAVDSLAITNNITLIKIDAEGHEPAVMRGLMNIVQRDKPILIIETVTSDVRDKLSELGYSETKHKDSPNIVFRVPTQY